MTTCWPALCAIAEMAESTSEEESFIARRTESVDAEGISKLLTRTSETVFGRINVDYLM